MLTLSAAARKRFPFPLLVTPRWHVLVTIAQHARARPSIAPTRTVQSGFFQEYCFSFPKPPSVPLSEPLPSPPEPRPSHGNLAFRATMAFHTLPGSIFFPNRNTPISRSSSDRR